MTKDKNEMSTEELLKFQRIETFKNEIKSMIATSKEALVKTDNREAKNRYRCHYTKEDIRDIVAEGDAVARAELSKYFFSISGLYKRIVLHYATFLTYSWLLVPHIKNQLKDKLDDKKNMKVYYDAADFASNFDIERKCSLFAKDVLVQGGCYGIIHDNGDNIVIQDLPFEYCRSRFKNSQDVDIVEFDMRFFDSISDADLRAQILKTYPKCVQKGYTSFKSGRASSPWIYLPAEIGIYFTLFEERPFFLDLIPLIDDLEDYKQIDKDRNLLSLKRILTQKVPTDGMNLVFEPEEAAEMHEGVLEMLANNPDVDVVTSYNDIDLLDLSSDADETTEVTDAQQLIYDSAGVSKELFSATTDTGLTYSLNNDLSMMMVLGQRFSNFFTALINNKFATRKLKFKLLILPISFYNKDDYTSKAKDLAAFGYSFLTPILSTGIDQTNLADLKTLENEVLNLDEVLTPLQSAYTQSGKTNAVTAAAAKSAEESTEEKDTEESEEKTEEESKEEESKDNGGEDENGEQDNGSNAKS